MRSRITIVLAAICLSLAAPRPAHAGGWAAFVAWISKLDPKVLGIGVEGNVGEYPAKVIHRIHDVHNESLYTVAGLR